MGRIVLALLAMLAAGPFTVAEGPPYQHLLQGDDAQKAAALQKRIGELWVAGNFAQALGPAKDLQTLRRQVQGKEHWQTADAACKVQTLRAAARLPAAKQAQLARAPALMARAVALYQRGRYADAEPLCREALGIYEELLGPGHPDTAESTNDLGQILGAQGRSKEAEPLFRKALALRQELLGSRHPDTAASYNSLAANLQEQGRAGEAEPLHRRALAVREEVLGPKHPDTVHSYNNLAVNLAAQGRYKDAELLFRKALEVNQEILGPRHPATATSYNNLAYVFSAQGRYRDAEPLNRQALAVRLEVLGATHPLTASSYSNLALNLQAQGHPAEAELLFRKALAIKEEVLGPKHPDTAASYNSLATNLQEQGRPREAEPLFRQALAVCEEVLGPKHPNTAQGYNNLAANLDTQARYREAEPLYRKALAIEEEVLGPRHPTAALGYNNLAYILQVQGRPAEAEPLYRKALAIQEEVLGAKHADTARSYNNLAVNLGTLGRYTEAEPLLRHALALRQEILGPGHPDTAISYNSLAQNLQAQGRSREAEPLLRQALAVWEEVLGRTHPDTATAANNLAQNLQAQGRYQDAEPLWRAATEGIEAARLRLAATSLDKAAAVHIRPFAGLAACRARLGQPTDAWRAAEKGLARGLLDDLAAGVLRLPDSQAAHHDQDRAAQLAALDRDLLPLLAAQKLSDGDRPHRHDLLQQRRKLDEELARVAAERSSQALESLQAIQARLAADEALIVWIDLPTPQGAIDPQGDHWGCVLRHTGAPAWEHLAGSGAGGAWTEADDRLPRLLRDDLAHGEPQTGRHARRLARQRLDPLLPHLSATGELPDVRDLLIVPVGSMAGVPIEALTERYRISYTPSGSVLARLRGSHRPLHAPTLLALGDPNFQLPRSTAPPRPPEQGLYLLLVVPGGNAARAGLRAGDVLLRYASTPLVTRADLKICESGDPVPVLVWREGKMLEPLRLPAGKLGVMFADDPPPLAQRKHQEQELLADARSREEISPLPGTRREVTSLAALLPQTQSRVLLGSDASQQNLDELARTGKLKEFRLIHLATHGSVDPVAAAYSALKLARDRLSGPQEQVRRATAGQKVYTGQLSVADIARDWQLDADLVTLSACETALGPQGGGEGLLGFSQVLLGRGARSLVLSLWKVDDTATALLMQRFYQNLLGKRTGLETPLSKMEALQEAKSWLRGLSWAEVDTLAAQLPRSALRATQEKARRPNAEVAEAVPMAGEKPFCHPRYWAAFILLGDPD